MSDYTPKGPIVEAELILRYADGGAVLHRIKDDTLGGHRRIEVERKTVWEPLDGLPSFEQTIHRMPVADLLVIQAKMPPNGGNRMTSLIIPPLLDDGEDDS